jgi:hypothetical protein
LLLSWTCWLDLLVDMLTCVIIGSTCQIWYKIENNSKKCMSLKFLRKPHCNIPTFANNIQLLSTCLWEKISQIWIVLSLSHPKISISNRFPTRISKYFITFNLKWFYFIFKMFSWIQKYLFVLTCSFNFFLVLKISKQSILIVSKIYSKVYFLSKFIQMVCSKFLKLIFKRS